MTPPSCQSKSGLHCLQPREQDLALLAEFFVRIKETDNERFFHPHPLSEAEAKRIILHDGQDIYLILTDGSCVYAYGMLRGWDEGYAIPSLGLAVNPDFHGSGIGRLMMNFLHLTAKLRGCESIRLKVDKMNDRAISLYKSLGYVFEEFDDGQLLGKFSIQRPQIQIRETKPAS